MRFFFAGLFPGVLFQKKTTREKSQHERMSTVTRRARASSIYECVFYSRMPTTASTHRPSVRMSRHTCTSRCRHSKRPTPQQDHHPSGCQDAHVWDRYRHAAPQSHYGDNSAPAPPAPSILSSCIHHIYIDRRKASNRNTPHASIAWHSMIYWPSFIYFISASDDYIHRPHIST